MNLDIQTITTRLLQAREAYYNTDKPIMGDAEFDALEENLRNLDPNHEYFSLVGIPDINGSGGGKIRHKVPMLSMAKAKNLNEVEKWLQRLNPDPEMALTIQPKIDGLSASLYYRNGHLQYIASRGDGVSGQDISHIARYVKDIPEAITFTQYPVEIRGELHLPKDTEYDTRGKPLRNNCVGLINRKDDRDNLHYVRFLAYQIIRSDGMASDDNRLNSEFGIIDLLKDNGFYTFDKWRFTPGGDFTADTEGLVSSFPGIIDADSESDTDTSSGTGPTSDLVKQISLVYEEYIGHLRDEWNYETDGLIIVVDDNRLHDEIDERWVVDHHHHYALAFKPPSQATETTLKNIIWQLSRQGNLTPVAVFETVRMGGASLERASLHNAENVRRLKLSKGDRILVERANDVIPYIRSNISSDGRKDDFIDNHLWPGVCPSCGSTLVERGVHIACPNPECRDKVLQSILFWVKQAEMEQVALKTLEALYDAGKLRTIHNLYTLKADDFEGMDGFGEKKIRNFLEQVSSAKSLSAVELISRLGIPMVQKKSLARLGISSLEDFLSFDDESYVTGKRIVDWKAEPGNLDFLNQLLETVDLRETAVSDLQRGVICLTGKAPVPRKALIAALEEKGWTVAGAVTKETVKVVCDDTSGTSTKLKKARDAGIKIVTYREFLEEEGLDTL